MGGHGRGARVHQRPLWHVPVPMLLNPRSRYKMSEQFAWKENQRCGSTIQDYRECTGALKHHLHGRGIKSVWHHALVAVSHWLVRVWSRSSHLWSIHGRLLTTLSNRVPFSRQTNPGCVQGEMLPLPFTPGAGV
jgi:hypothetical protein